MSFVTAYSDFFRAHPLQPSIPCRPEERWVENLNGWFDTGKQENDVIWTDEEKADFLRRASKGIWGSSTYREHFCERFKKYDERVTDKRYFISGDEADLSKEGTVMMNTMRDTFERDPQRHIQQPPNTHRRITGYSRTANYQCGLSIYQQDIGQQGYVSMKNNLLKPATKENHHRSRKRVLPIFALTRW